MTRDRAARQLEPSRLDGLPAPIASALEPVRRRRAIRRYRQGPLRRRYPRTPDELRESELFRAWWYYGVELLPAVVTEGLYPIEMPMLPRLLLRRCAVDGVSCLDVGAMEGLVPILLRKRGARKVLAVDAANHCRGKIDAVQHYHGVGFDFRSVGLMYSLHEQLRGDAFDLVNCSGLLYHVLSPISVLASLRPLLKRNGVIVISTHVTLDPEPVADFNAAGRMHREPGTFWFLSVTLLEYVLRYMRLVPIDCAFMPSRAWSREGLARLGRRADFPKEGGYLSVACRAVDNIETDDWMAESFRHSPDHRALPDWPRADAQPWSEIEYEAPREPAGFKLTQAVRERAPVMPPVEAGDSHVLMLDATS